MNLGKQGEQLVADYLQKNGFTILEHNFKKFYGEIDLIAQKKELVVFVEVKTRKKSYFNLSQVILPSKQRKIIKAAQSFIAQHRLYDKILRFDVALIEGEIKESSLQYIPNAFTKIEAY